MNKKIDVIITIFRNYNWIPIQRAIFNRLFDKSEYRLIWNDNSPNCEKRVIFPQDNEIVVYRDYNHWEFDGVSFGNAIEHGLQYVETENVLVLDSDFYLFRKEMLEEINEDFESGYKAVGAKYCYKEMTSKLFPELFNNIPWTCCTAIDTNLARSVWWGITREAIDFSTSFIDTGCQLRRKILDEKIKTKCWDTKQDDCDSNHIYRDDNGNVIGLHVYKGSSDKVQSQLAGELATIFKKYAGITL